MRRLASRLADHLIGVAGADGKVFHGMLSGSIPIYLGASATLEQLVPPGSVIYTDDFDTPQDLANYLHYLSKNETAYNERLTWRAKPLPTPMQKWIDLMKWQYKDSTTMSEARCELCRFLHQAPKRSSRRPAPTMPAPKQRVRINFPAMPDATADVPAT